MQMNCLTAVTQHTEFELFLTLLTPSSSSLTGRNAQLAPSHGGHSGPVAPLKGPSIWPRSRRLRISIHHRHHHRKLCLQDLVSPTDNQQELKAMSTPQNRWKQWAQKHKAKQEMRGLALGRELGMARGKHEGLAKSVLLQLALQFGPLPDWVIPHLAKATDTQLQAYLGSLLNASSLNEVIDPGSQSL
jgi:hypothetical protein